jgi:hypothetical protein
MSFHDNVEHRSGGVAPARIRRLARLRRGGLVALIMSGWSGGCRQDPPAADGRCGNDGCAITLSHVAILSDSVDPGLFPLGRSMIVQRDGRGRFYVVARTADRFAVFDSSGRDPTLIGRRGSGPGEYQRATGVIPGPGDTVYVSDERLRRVTVYAPDLSLVRILHMAHPPSFVQEDGSFIVARQLPTPASIGYPIHRFDREGQLRLSFGADTPQFRQDLTRIVNRIAAPARDGTIWTVAPGRYEIERWDPSEGRRVARMTIGSQWFTESLNDSRPDYERPDPLIVGLWEDSVGMVWVLVRVADSAWKPPPASERQTERVFDIAEYSQTYDWILEAVDPATATVVATRRFPDYLEHRPPSNLVVSVRSISLLAATLDVWLPVIQPNGERDLRK